MLMLLQWKIVIISVILPLNPFAIHCISHRQLLVLVSSPVQASFRYRRHAEVEVGAAAPATAVPPIKRQFEE